MQPSGRTYQQIYDELGSVYDPQANLLRQQQQAIPGQLQAEEQGLQAKQTQAYDDILSGARRRGVAAGGIPMGEQAKYSATEYMPALARLHQSGREQATSLEQAILGIQEKRANQAQQNYQYDSSLAEQRRQFDLQQRAAAGNGFSPTYSPSTTNNPKSATAIQRADKGYNFTDPSGRPISAAAYASVKGIPFRTLLETMAKGGDAGAKQALGFVGNDFGYDPRKIGNAASIYNNLVWGTGRTAAAPNNPRLL